MQIKAFSLIELLIVVLLIGIISFLSLNLISTKKRISIKDLRDILRPNGEFILYRDKEEFIVDNKRVKYYIPISDIEVFKYSDGNWNRVEFRDNILFDYRVRNGIGDSFVLKSNQGIFVFKPLFIYEVKNLQEAKDLYLLKSFQPKEGSYF